MASPEPPQDPSQYPPPPYPPQYPYAPQYQPPYPTQQQYSPLLGWLPWAPGDVYLTGRTIVLPPIPYGTQFPAPPGHLVQIFAGAGRRLVARIIDSLVLAVGAWVMAALFTVADLPTAITVFLAVVLGLALLCYEPVLTTLYGGGLGKLAVGIRVVRAHDTLRTPHFGFSLLRWLVYVAMGLVSDALIFPVFLDVLWQLWDRPYRQCLHDKAAATIVVRKLTWCT